MINCYTLCFIFAVNNRARNARRPKVTPSHKEVESQVDVTYLCLLGVAILLVGFTYQVRDKVPQKRHKLVYRVLVEVECTA
jgi:hypothetical protein